MMLVGGIECSLRHRVVVQIGAAAAAPDHAAAVLLRLLGVETPVTVH